MSQSGNQMFKKLNELMKNVVPSRELMTDSFTRDGHDSAFESTQQMNSQCDFSQINSQDLFTQQYSSGSQSEMSGVGIPIRRPSMYDKWMSKGPMYKGVGPQSDTKIPQSSVKTQNVNLNNKPELMTPQFHLNKSKAKDRDERDLLQQVSSLVQECTKEIKGSVTSMKDKIQHGQDLTSDKVQEIISTFLGELCQQQDKILNAVKEKENRMIRINQLEKDMAMKDATISQLEKQLEERIDDDKENMIKSFKKEIKEPTVALDKKMSKVLEWMNEGTDLSNQQMSDFKQQLEIQRKFNMESRQKQQKNIKDTEYRVLEELSTMKQDLKYREDIWQKQCLDQLHKVQENQFRNLQKQLISIVERSPKNKGSGSENFNFQPAIIEDIFQNQWRNIEMFLESQFNRQTEMQEQHLDRIMEKFYEPQSKSVERHQGESDFQLSLPYFEEHFGKYHEDVKKQIEDLHKSHQNEIRRIQEELKQHRIAKEKSPKTNNMQIVPQNLQAEIYGNRYLGGTKEILSSSTTISAFDKAKTLNNPQLKPYQNSTSYTIPPTRRSPFSSYGPLNSRSLFSKSQPSPIAAVLPQRKGSNYSSILPPTTTLTAPINLPVEKTKNIEDHDNTEDELYEDFVETDEDGAENDIKISDKPIKLQKKKSNQKKRKRKSLFSNSKKKPCTTKSTNRNAPVVRKTRTIDRVDAENLISNNLSKPRILRSSNKSNDINNPDNSMNKLNENNNAVLVPSKNMSKLQSPNDNNFTSIPNVNNNQKLISYSSNIPNVKSVDHRPISCLSNSLGYPNRYTINSNHGKPPASKTEQSIYDFEEECPPPPVFGFRQPQTTYTYERRYKQFPTNDKQCLPVAKPVLGYNSPREKSVCTYGTSRESSPSMSLTEVVIKRKIKCDTKKTPDLRNFHHAQDYNYEQSSEIGVLGASPNQDGIFSKVTAYHDGDQESIYPIPSRAGNEKRNDGTSNFVEITESIRRRTQKRYFQLDNL